ncbi:Protein of unknown function [Lactobacillus delbrueckii subsp. bulgaricus]|nr:Protein of unknown function [Lactobacillus delbrueckii subsp. bulgaricus]
MVASLTWAAKPASKPLATT